MTKNSHERKAGLSPKVNLGDLLTRDMANVGEDELPVSVEAANRLAREVHLDPKTGLLNEQTWRKNLAHNIENLKDGDRLLVWYGDVLKFKLVNDEFGHAAGNVLIGLIGEAVRRTFRRDTDSVTLGSDETPDSPDGLSRLHGDEFAVSTLINAEDQGQRLLTDSEALEFQSQQLNANIASLTKGTMFEALDVTISLGLASYRNGESMDDLIARADQSMYASKGQSQ